VVAAIALAGCLRLLFTLPASADAIGFAAAGRQPRITARLAKMIISYNNA
jgi:hypothetical protein